MLVKRILLAIALILLIIAARVFFGVALPVGLGERNLAQCSLANLIVGDLDLGKSTVAPQVTACVPRVGVADGEQVGHARE